MTSVERVVEYTELKSEALWRSQQHLPSDWPSKGQLTFNRLNFSYSTNGPLVLKDISATFQPREKVRRPDCTQSFLLFSGWTVISCRVCHQFVSGWYRGSDWSREEFFDLCSVPPGRASGADLHRWCSDIRDRPPWPASEDVHHPSGKEKQSFTNSWADVRVWRPLPPLSRIQFSSLTQWEKTWIHSFSTLMKIYGGLWMRLVFY